MVGNDGVGAITDYPEHVIVGRVLGIQGVSGAVKVEISSDVPHRFNVGEFLYISGIPYRITSSTRLRRYQVILKLEGLNTPEAVRGLVGQPVTVPKTVAPDLPEGEYYYFQILDLRVCTDSGEELGRVTEILETGSNDVYVVSGQGGDILIPALAEVIQEINLAEGVMVVKLLEGLR